MGAFFTVGNTQADFLRENPRKRNKIPIHREYLELHYWAQKPGLQNLWNRADNPYRACLRSQYRNRIVAWPKPKYLGIHWKSEFPDFKLYSIESINPIESVPWLLIAIVLCQRPFVSRIIDHQYWHIVINPNRMSHMVSPLIVDQYRRSLYRHIAIAMARGVWTTSDALFRCDIYIYRRFTDLTHRISQSASAWSFDIGRRPTSDAISRRSQSGFLPPLA